MLSTQNPVDLDYKGLANAGTWWIGRLQTERDKMRVIEGLEGAAASSGAGFDRAAMERIMAGLGNRIFLMRNVHDDAPVVFQSRWALSYLRGPMTLSQIKQVCGDAAPAAPAASRAPLLPAEPEAKALASSAPATAARPVLPPEIAEYFLRPANPAGDLTYRASVLGVSKLHFVDAKAGLDQWVTRSLLAPIGEDGLPDWEAARVEGDLKSTLDRQPVSGATFAPPPSAATRKQSAAQWQKTLEAHLYQNVTLELFSCPALKLVSKPGETEGDFRVRAVQTLREQRDVEIAKLKTKFAAKLQTLTDRVRRGEERVEREKAQAGQQKLSTALGLGATILGALMGRRVVTAGNVSRATSTMKSASKIGKESADVERAGESLEITKQRLAELEAQVEAEVETLHDRYDADRIEIDRAQVRPRKSDIMIGAVGLCWTPWKKSPDGLVEPA